MKTVDSRGLVARRARFVSAALALALIATGCGGPGGPKLSPVTGKVTRDGQAVSGAEIMFLPQQQAAPSSGRTDQNGRFELRYNDGRPGAPPGKYQVIITLAASTGASAGGGGDEPPPKDAAPPAEFRKEAEVNPSGQNDFAFEISK